jgi:hypothetical protein
VLGPSADVAAEDDFAVAVIPTERGPTARAEFSAASARAVAASDGEPIELRARARHGVEVAERDAEWAEADALAAIDFASAAIEKAVYAVLDAVLARKDADVMAATSSG